MSKSVAPLEGKEGGIVGPIEVILLAPRGFCAGVRRAIDAVEEALARFGPPVYVRRAIVHNLVVVRSLEAKGAVFVQELEEVPEGAVVILSAHGVPNQVLEQAKARNLRTFDAVCPLVSKVHREVVRHHRDGRHIFLIGHQDHPEIVGTLGKIPLGSATVVGTVKDALAVQVPSDTAAAYAVQTTFSVDEAAFVINILEDRFIDLAAPLGSDICYATTNRQAAVKMVAPTVDAILVAGEDFSSNARRLAEVARSSGCSTVQLVADADRIDWLALDKCRSIAITAAASTPELTVTSLIEALAKRFPLRVREVGGSMETTVFKPLRFDRHAA